MSKLASELGKVAGPLSQLVNLLKVEEKKQDEKAEMQGSNRMTPMAKMMAGGPMKRKRSIDGCAMRGKTRAV